MKNEQIGLEGKMVSALRKFHSAVFGAAFLISLVVLTDGRPAMAQQPAQSPDADAALAAVRGYVDGLNAPTYEAAYEAAVKYWAPDSDGVIIDGFPPYFWQGQRPFAQWWKSVETALKPRGLSVGYALNAVKKIQVVDNGAYVATEVAGMVYGGASTFLIVGEWTFVLARKDKSAPWLITSWAWGGPDRLTVPVPVRQQ